MKFEFRISGDIGGPSPITVRMEYLFHFNFDIVNFVEKTNEGGTESIVLLIFVPWRCFNCRWVMGGGVLQKV